MCFPIQRSDRFTIALVNIPTIWRMPQPAAPARPTRAGLPSIFPGSIGAQLRLQVEAAAQVSAISLLIFLAARLSVSRRDHNRREAQTSKCRSRSLSKKPLPVSQQTSPSIDLSSARAVKAPATQADQ